MSTSVLETENHLNWKRHLWSRHPSSNLTLLPPPLIPTCHIYMAFKYRQGWQLPHIPEQPVPMPDKKFFLMSNLNVIHQIAKNIL